MPYFGTPILYFLFWLLQDIPNLGDEFYERIHVNPLNTLLDSGLIYMIQPCFSFSLSYISYFYVYR